MLRTIAKTRLLTFVFAIALAASAGAAELPETFTAALKQAGIPLNRVAVVVQPLDGDMPLLSHQADAAMNPASVMKLVTSYAALQQLGPGFTWATEIWAEGALKDGVLDGDLAIRGNGDPSLTLERMWLLQRELRTRGIHHIRGNLVLDSTVFDSPEVDPGAFDGEPHAPYNAAAGALVANFNVIPLRLNVSGDQVVVTPGVALPDGVLASQLKLDDGLPCHGWRDALRLSPADPPAVAYAMAGPYPRSCGEQPWPRSLFDAAMTFDVIFRALWAESGGTLRGATLNGRAQSAPPLLTFASEPLADTLRRLNKYSSNLMAKNLFLTLGMQTYGVPATPEKGAQAVRDTLLRAGISTHKLVLENGSGLSRIERIRADTLNQLLRTAYRGPLFAEFESALPIMAIDGTLKQRFRDSPVAGRAHLKTGSLRDVSALAGYVMTARGRRTSFVMLVNHANARQAEAAQRALLEWVWDDVPR